MPERVVTGEEFVELRDVEVLRDIGLAVLYRIDRDGGSRIVAVPPRLIQSGSTARRPHGRGTLVIPRWLARQLGLLALEPELENGCISFEDVEALADDGRALLCRVNGRLAWVPYEAMGMADGVVGKPGERGRLVLPLAVAIELRLCVACFGRRRDHTVQATVEAETDQLALQVGVLGILVAHA